MTERTKDGWGEPRNLGAPVNTDANEWFASATKDGTIYFSSSRAGGGDSQLYRSRYVNGRYSTPENLTALNEGGAGETEPYVSPDESFILFSSYGRPDGYGGWDIYISFNRNGNWTPPKNLGPLVNTSTRDYSPRLTPEGRYLFFTSERNFATAPLARRLSYPGLLTEMRGVLNGNGNIYQMELSALVAQSTP